MKMILGAASVGAANMFTDNAIAKALIELPQDKYTKTVALVRETILANDLLNAKRIALGYDIKTGGGHDVWWKTEEFNQLTATGNNCLQFITDNFEPGTVDEVQLLFDHYLTVDILNEAELRSLTDGVIPVAVARAMILHYHMPFDMQRMPAFDSFADKYRGVILGSTSPEYKRRAAAIRDADRGTYISYGRYSDPDPVLVERLKKDLVEYVLNNARGSKLIV